MQRAQQRVTWAVFFVWPATSKQLIYLLLCALVYVGCDSEPGLEDPNGRPPIVANLSFSPEQLDVASLDASQVQDGLVEVMVDISVEVTDADSDLDRVVFVLRSPVQEQDALAFETLALSEFNTYGGTFPISFDTGLIGNYVVEVYAVDTDNLLSNRVLGTFSILNQSQPPVIEEIIGPDTIQRPESGTRQEQLIAVVSDPDGVSNIANVLFWNVENPGTTFSLFDDGAQGGDDVAGDGRFTVTIVISSTNAVGTNTFAFQATDRSGLTSDIVRKDITVE